MACICLSQKTFPPQQLPLSTSVYFCLTGIIQVSELTVLFYIPPFFVLFLCPEWLLRFPYWDFGFLWWLSGKESACNAGDLGLIPGLGKSPGEGNGNPLQCSCLGNPMSRGAYWTTVHWVTKKSDTTQQLNNKVFHCTYIPHLLYPFIHLLMDTGLLPCLSSYK